MCYNFWVLYMRSSSICNSAEYFETNFSRLTYNDSISYPDQYNQFWYISYSWYIYIYIYIYISYSLNWYLILEKFTKYSANQIKVCELNEWYRFLSFHTMMSAYISWNKILAASEKYVRSIWRNRGMENRLPIISLFVSFFSPSGVTY